MRRFDKNIRFIKSVNKKRHKITLSKHCNIEKHKIKKIYMHSINLNKRQRIFTILCAHLCCRITNHHLLDLGLGFFQSHDLFASPTL